ncbi:ER membrane protein (Wsc4), putative [Metarhizium acridum CQMa 102]|uniref:ER membrane protein (Wsc4), putative n=1 Tax=Metarhizium acridum (strain CQMa 102) TaxID=655827 RepID=E9DUX2_METAQ|nr:ER membrane protein (Wsc4), putative [Metarhizium acridum CQMa 102]EFY92539.1 ER membrane protein (Wsc4), putative [Metarhizium acridum CQMa 102]
MPSPNLTGARGVARLLLMTASLVSLADAIDVDICASLNTADMNRNLSIFQTNGLCHDYCTPKDFAYAITQSNSCWCSNYTPAKSAQVATSKCSMSCPGYPDEKCGGAGVYGYVFLNVAQPSGTKGSDSSTTSESTEATSKPTSAISTLTADGTVKTVTIVPTATGHTSGDNQGGSVQDSGLNTGGIVGIVVGVVGGILVLAGLIILFYLRRKKQQQENDYQDDPSIRGSSSGMMGSGRPEMSRAPGSPGSTGNRSSTLQIDPRMDPFQQSLYARSGSRESVNTLRDDHDYSRRIQQPKVLRTTNPDPE